MEKIQMKTPLVEMDGDIAMRRVIRSRLTLRWRPQNTAWPSNARRSRRTRSGWSNIRS